MREGGNEQNQRKWERTTMGEGGNELELEKV